MTEAELLAEVIALCDRLGLLWHHDPDSRRSQGSPGFPDLVIAGSRGVVFRELKTEGADTSGDQDRWGWALERALNPARRIDHFDVMGWGIWRPSDLRSGLIWRQLEALS